MNNDDEILKSLISGGIIGAGLGALVSKNKEEGVTLGALAGAAILATFKANENAKKTNVTRFVEENGSLYQINPNGEKIFIKKIEKPAVKLKEHFKLK
jgi:hypothetical protein